MKDCSICNNERYFYKEDKAIECDCLLRDRVLKYLGEYALAVTIKNFKVLPHHRTNLFFTGKDKEPIFKSTVKSFLLYTGMEYSFHYREIGELFISLMGDGEEAAYRECIGSDFFILRLKGNYKNQAYAGVVLHLLGERKFSKKFTWIYSDYSWDDPYFRKVLYNEELYSFLNYNYRPMILV